LAGSEVADKHVGGAVAVEIAESLDLVGGWDFSKDASGKNFGLIRIKGGDAELVGGGIIS
jgi:hypothetical protein